VPVYRALAAAYAAEHEETVADMSDGESEALSFALYYLAPCRLVATGAPQGEAARPEAAPPRVVEREIPPVVGLVAEALDDERRARARASKAPSPASPHQGSAVAEYRGAWVVNDDPALARDLARHEREPHQGSGTAEQGPRELDNAALVAAAERDPEDDAITAELRRRGFWNDDGWTLTGHAVLTGEPTPTPPGGPSGHDWQWVAANEPDVCRRCHAFANGMNANDPCPGTTPAPGGPST
jgi:hypothetical protein